MSERAEHMTGLPDRDISYDAEGTPQGQEKVQFSHLGVRLAILNEDGSLSVGDFYNPEMLGGVAPSPGDRISTLWCRNDPNDADLFEVLSRHYVGEFDGDNCWWLIVKPLVPDRLEKALYELHRTESAEKRERRRAFEGKATREALLLAERLAKPQKASKPRQRKRGSNDPQTD